MLWRKFEDKLAALYIQQSKGFLHLYNGQKQSLLVHCMRWTWQDKMITAYRNHVQPEWGVDQNA
jgi:pyruvate dehydrogenase E1 component alpha subunit